MRHRRACHFDRGSGYFYAEKEKKKAKREGRVRESRFTLLSREIYEKGDKCHYFSLSSGGTMPGMISDKKKSLSRHAAAVRQQSSCTRLFMYERARV